jgi:NodT family efflux transporter outer membrane factor (OMF) lipoprotein
VPARWSAGSASSDAALARWWERFGDPTLDRLVRDLLESNPDLRIAAARVRRALALAGVEESAILPSVGLGGGATRARRSENAVEFPVDLTRTIYQGGLTTSWEIDFFGGTRRAVEAAGAEVEAAEAERQAARVALLGELGRAYASLRGAQRLREVLARNAAAARDTSTLTASRMQAGVATALEASRARAQAEAAEAPLPAADAEIARAVHRIGVLVGKDPGSLRETLSRPGPPLRAPAELLAGMPVELVSRRPDVKAAERRLAAATARVGAATAELYPRLSLTGAFGLESLESGDFLDAASRTWSVGPSIRWPIFTAGRIRAGIRAAEAGVDEAAAAFDRALLRALEEVENGLTAWFRESERGAALARAAATAQESARLAEELQARGLASFLEVLEAQQDGYALEREAAASDALKFAALAGLYAALGGGWDPPAAK